MNADRRERGASLVEYALLITLVVLACIGALRYFGSETGESLDRSGSSVTQTVP